MSLLTFHSLYVHGRLHSACRGIGNSWSSWWCHLCLSLRPARQWKVCRSCAALRGQSDHNFDKFWNEILLWQKLAQESSENERVQAKCASFFLNSGMRMLLLHCQPLHCLADRYHIQWSMPQYFKNNLYKRHENVQKSHLRHRNI